MAVAQATRIEKENVSNTESGDYEQWQPKGGPLQLQQVDVKPERVTLKVGNFEVLTRDMEIADIGEAATPKQPGTLISPKNIRVLLDGKPIRARRFTVYFDIEEAPVITLDFYPEVPGDK